ncbi:hypothetical protein [Acinetobacter junii]|jgi:hypothetical protein|uniref:hypothetical protein n=1 Tax=Acinetobacter junii TaxID=40215 RepID=UPI0024AD0303|nr:hypothetical protein [Acinetobacter junii]MDI6622783.1 hypothetical protein [Acinetobacter junii]
MADLIVHLGLLKPWSIAQEVSVEREKSQKKPTLGKVGYQLETTALISKWNYNAFRITCIMLILENLINHKIRNIRGYQKIFSYKFFSKLLE